MSATARPVMIFHAPYPLNRQGAAASAIRPVRMRDAFEAAGYDVIEITGSSSDRRRLMRAVHARIKQGLQVDFVYSESSTMPIALTDPDHFPRHPLLDLSFLRFCRRQGIPTGMFYRDVYWQFPEYRAAVTAPVAVGMRAMYRWDLFRFRQALSRVFLPSDRMAEYLPRGLRARSLPLPPASDVVDMRSVDGENPDLTILFVGGLGAYYRMHEAVRGVEQSAQARMVLCTRPAQWADVREEYAPIMGDRTHVVHLAGEELQTLYSTISLGSLFMEPIEYREFAAPLKMYEYLGNGKPIIATQGSLVAEFVVEHGVGWVIPYEAEALSSLLDRLSADRQELDRVIARVREVREQHTWVARAQQVARHLTEASVS